MEPKKVVSDLNPSFYLTTFENPKSMKTGYLSVGLCMMFRGLISM
jgi:hypothetical protein